MKVLVLVFLLYGALTVIPPAVPRTLPAQAPGIVLILDDWPAHPRRRRNHYGRRLNGGTTAHG